MTTSGNIESHTSVRSTTLVSLGYSRRSMSEQRVFHATTGTRANLPAARPRRSE